MNIAIIGLPKSGKTTIFNALTGQSAQTSGYASQKVEPNRGVVNVEDRRVRELSCMYEPKKTVYATVDFVDFTGLASGSGGEVFSGEALQLIKNSDALAVVVRNFSDDVIDQAYGAPEPSVETDEVITELMLSDQILAEKRLDRIHADIKRGKKTLPLLAEKQVMEKLSAHLDSGLPVSSMELGPEEQKTISGFQFLTSKPLFIILNSGEDNYGKNEDVVSAISEKHPVVEFSGNFEMELSSLDDEEEQAEFMADMGITESARVRLTTFAYAALGYMSFFTVGKDEVRAWTIHTGAPAVDAAGAIHSDLARGFIRAEVFTYDDLISCGSEKQVKTAGKFRLEGKQYTVQDGDILNIRFSV